MKKGSTTALLWVTAAFTVFTGGFLIGKTLFPGPAVITVELPPVVEENISDLRDVDLANGQRIDLNSATAEELTTLPGVGATLAQRIITYRETNGPFTNIYELDNVEGIGSKLIASIADKITLEEMP